MLASITPLGERGRSSRWHVTVAFFVAGSTISAAALGLVAATLGSLTWPGQSGSAHMRLAVLAVAPAGSHLLDLGVGGGRPPAAGRQGNGEGLAPYTRGRLGVRLA